MPFIKWLNNSLLSVALKSMYNNLKNTINSLILESNRNQTNKYSIKKSKLLKYNFKEK